MSGSVRDAILSRIRHAAGASGDDAARKRAVAERLAAHKAGVIPERGQRSPEERIALFTEMAEKADATVARVADHAAIGPEVARFLREANLPATIRSGADERLARADFSQTSVALSHGPSTGDDLNALSHAFGGVAETGTLMLLSGQDNPTSLNFLPENHIVAVSADTIAGDMEALFSGLRERYGAGLMPRSVNYVTGPSRSADIEQTLLLGAHGPKRLHIIVVG